MREQRLSKTQPDLIEFRIRSSNQISDFDFQTQNFRPQISNSKIRWLDFINSPVEIPLLSNDNDFQIGILSAKIFQVKNQVKIILKLSNWFDWMPSTASSKQQDCLPGLLNGLT